VKVEGLNCVTPEQVDCVICLFRALNGKTNKTSLIPFIGIMASSDGNSILAHIKGKVPVTSHTLQRITSTDISHLL
jgi:hypothetical protein